MGETNPMEQPAAQRFRVLAVEPDERLRTRMTLELAGNRGRAGHEHRRHRCAMSLPGEPTVVVFGASLANTLGFEAVRTITRALPEVGIVLLAEELTLPLLQEALRAGVRDAVTLDAGESQIRQAIERVGETMSAITNRAAAAIEPKTLGKVIVELLDQGWCRQERRRRRTRRSCSRRSARVASRSSTATCSSVTSRCCSAFRRCTPRATPPPAIDSADTQLMDGLLATHEASALRVLCAPVEPSAGDKITPAGDDRHRAHAAAHVRLRRHRHAAALRRRRARAARRGRRGAARREHGHPEHQEPEGRHPDARPACRWPATSCTWC